MTTTSARMQFPVVDLDSEARLYSTNAEREKYESQATLFGIIVALEYLERAYVRDAINAAEYTPACTRLLSQYKTMLKLVGDSVPSVEEFMGRYNMDHPAALHRVQVGVPATIEHSSEQQGSAETAKWVAETTQSFITFMDALNLRLRAKDQLHPRLQELMTGYARFKDSAKWEGRGKIVSWLITLNAMKASDEISEDQARQTMLSAIRPSINLTARQSVFLAQRRTVISLAKTVYTAHATASGAGRNGSTKLDDGSLDIKLASPKEMGGSGQGNNPEQLFALGYASCFLGALQLVAKNKNAKLSDDVKIKAAVSIGEAKGSGGFGIGVELTAIGADAALVHEAHTVCPYSRILKEGAEVKLNIQ
ncbi:unnamed protein product [Rhizoctonia solani]|uniref:Vacuolar protein sorting-associated protein 28 n=1 Tax=Rhizoctonia solani TaxID=456999 RepID=A0A8H3GF22_9AGAM|nr:unnamed protein product [Rhizoctonia solani]